MKTFEEQNYEVYLFSRKELVKQDFDWETDLEDYVEEKIKKSGLFEDFKIVRCGWDIEDKTFVVIIKVKK